MWKACVSPVRFSMVQSSTAPTVVVIGGRIGHTEDFRLLPVDGDEEFRGTVRSVGRFRKVDLAVRGNRRRLSGPRSAAASPEAAARTPQAERAAPARPCWCRMDGQFLRRIRVADRTGIEPDLLEAGGLIRGGPCMMNSARPAGGSVDGGLFGLVLSPGCHPIRRFPTFCGVVPNQICRSRKACEEAFATRQNSFTPGFITMTGDGDNGAMAG